MITSLRGTVVNLSTEAAVIEVGGVGLAVQCAVPTLRELRVGEATVLSTSLVVREDSLTLFGFATADDREVFLSLQTVSGVGPRLALAVLSSLTSEQLRAAVHGGDEATLMKVPGIGRKSAQRMVLELADRLSRPAPVDGAELVGSGASQGVGAGWQSPVRDALVSLGWSVTESEASVVALEERDVVDSSLPTAELISKMLALALRGMGSR